MFKSLLLLGHMRRLLSLKAIGSSDPHLSDVEEGIALVWPLHAHIDTHTDHSNSHSSRCHGNLPPSPKENWRGPQI